MAGRDQQLRVVISGDASQLKRAFAQAEIAGNKFEKGMGASIGRVGTALRHLSVGGFAAAGLGLGGLIKAGVDYEKEMARVKAVTGATGAQFKGLGDLAKQLGKDTKFSAGEAAQAMYELGSAGFKASELSKVLPGTLALAAASSVSLADAAQISSNALRGFGLESSKSTHVADVLAQAVASSSVEMQDLQLSLKYIGPVAKLTGQSFEDMIAAVELMGNAGIKGEQAGTSLRGALTRLTKPTKMVEEGFRSLGISASDINGPKGLKPLPQLIALVAKHSEGMAKSTRNAALAHIFGTEALSGMAVLVDQGAKKLEHLSKVNKDADGAAKKMATTMNNTVSGAFENFTGTVETAGITIFEKFQKPLRKALLGAAGIINDFPAQFNALEKGGRSAATSLAEAFGNVFGLHSNNMKLGAALSEMFKQVDWKGIGKTIAAGISGAVALSGDFSRSVERGIGSALSHIDGKKLLSGLLKVVAQAINALFSPKFWIDNFANILATVTIAIPIAKILKIPGAATLFRFISKPFLGALGAFGKFLVSAFGKVAEDGLTGFLGGLERLAPRTAHLLLNVVTGSGKWLSGLPGKFKDAGSRAIGGIVGAIGGGVGAIAGGVGRLIGAAIKKLGSLVPDFVTAGLSFARNLVKGMIDGVSKAIGGVGGAIKKGLKSIPVVGGLFGDGVGRSLGKNVGGALPSGGGGSSSLMGAQGALAPFAGIGSKFGLHVTSGRRPGSITSSGNVSFHSSGEAIDLGDGRGPDSNKLRFFNYMKNNYGARLAELIYTPGGAGIKNGSPYTYTGKVAADHFDHVHVALDTGKPGVGDGIGETVKAARGAGFGGAELVNMVAIAGRESNYRHGAHNYDPPRDDSWGDLQINVLPQANPRFKSWNLSDPNVNWKAGRILFNAAGYKPWMGAHGSPFDGVTPAMFANARAAVAGTTGTASTAGGGSGGGPSRSVLESHLQSNLDRLDTLRNQLAGIPSGKAHSAQRKALQGQIRALVSSNRGIRGDIRNTPTATETAQAGEKQGSRIVNAVAAPFFSDTVHTGSRGRRVTEPGIRSLAKLTKGLGTEFDDADTSYGQAVRRFDQSDEDLGTAAGRTKRSSEIVELHKLKDAQLKRQQARLQALVAEIAKYDGLIRALQAKLKGKKAPHGAAAARIHKRLIDYDNKRIELAAEAKSLGAAIEDTKLDLGDLDKELADVAGTPDTADAAAQDAGPSTTDKVSSALAHIAALERAGDITPEQSHNAQIQTLQSALGGAFGALTDEEALNLRGDLKEATSALTQATVDNTSAILENNKLLADQLKYADRVMAVSSAEATRFMVDFFSGQVGTRVQARRSMAGDGSLSRL